MTTPSTAVAPARAYVTPSITVEQGPLRAPQRVHAVAIVVVPTMGLVAALVLARRIGVSALDVGLLVGMFTATILGISVGYHRLFSHRSFEAARPIRVLLGVLGSMAGQGSLTYWVSNHRRHHHYADRPGDIHSPYYREDQPIAGLRGFWNAHMGWTFEHQLTNPLVFAKDLYRDPVIARVNQLYLLWVLVGLLLPSAVGGLVTRSGTGALTGFLWGGLVRLFFTYHFTNAIDSVNHIFGRRIFDTGDWSTNNVWMVMPTMGEGWHNNHHAFPSSAVFGFRWWQVDPGGLLIRAWERLGWAWGLQVPTAQAIAEKAAAGDSRRRPPAAREG